MLNSRRASRARRPAAKGDSWQATSGRRPFRSVPNDPLRTSAGWSGLLKGPLARLKCISVRYSTGESSDLEEQKSRGLPDRPASTVGEHDESSSGDDKKLSAKSRVICTSARPAAGRHLWFGHFVHGTIIAIINYNSDFGSIRMRGRERRTGEVWPGAERRPPHVQREKRKRRNHSSICAAVVRQQNQ